jgi:hypothetical protein
MPSCMACQRACLVTADPLCAVCRPPVCGAQGDDYAAAPNVDHTQERIRKVRHFCISLLRHRRRSSCRQQTWGGESSGPARR